MLKDGSLREMLGKKESRKEYYRCPNQCFTIFGTIAQTMIKREHVEALLNNKETQRIEFISKTGSRFLAKLKYNEERRKVEFVFE